ncbi:hypothetical protein METBIDRAFT_30896 [Metschnikowia bicuspidata var. bicuspidata NRRL YB-4993]|uniref:Uncharacterized protein n=1 Tax=Metschnikowia bicuspidata var. bicuspidata NRRL YB-4993 TaxID=869754 RepID=A0A1A0HD90_9ASCO|nr:hypothetical protein METBIDRAFT_30896 [Metschnikowia bicuspidata var. bicuspidata NRRL YB-4993]OBA21898.1 hypothetical protein METBIDRAFT_30896 [Metschnikowia bicuspidata var. bicuspidata NRRL YB-4993]
MHHIIYIAISPRDIELELPRAPNLFWDNHHRPNTLYNKKQTEKIPPSELQVNGGKRSICPAPDSPGSPGPAAPPHSPYSHQSWDRPRLRQITRHQKPITAHTPKPRSPARTEEPNQKQPNKKQNENEKTKSKQN